MSTPKDYSNEIPRDWAIEPSERVVVIDGERVLLACGGLSKERVRAALDAEDKKEAPGSGFMGWLIGFVCGAVVAIVIMAYLMHSGGFS